ncbi:MAG: HipA N-terminal domain-containing protein [Candidatus Dormibacteraceae bacterium]
MNEQLEIVSHQRVIAILERNPDGILSFRYVPHAGDNVAATPQISASLPIREEPYGEAELLPFFEGLLPEGLAREQLTLRFRLELTDVFGLLREIGRDIAGALSVVPPGTQLAATDEAVEWLDETQLAERVAELQDWPLAVNPELEIRISLAGVQSKMAVVIVGGRIGLPQGTTPSTHILKPTSPEAMTRRQRPVYPALVGNELLSLRLAQLSGLAVPQLALMRIDEQPALLIQRYDRE